jgi:hypothetical protein
VGPREESQLPVVLRQSELLHDGRGCESSVLVAEHDYVPCEAAADVEKGKQMIRQCEYEGEFGGK